MAGVNFAAPTIVGKGNVAQPSLGTIVFDTNDGSFWGRDESGGTGWVNLSAGASSLTGSVMAYAGAVAPPGYVLASGRTIGNAASGGTERAHSDTENLFALLWNSFANTHLPIEDSNGATVVRGADAASDFAANRRLSLPDLRGRLVLGRDDMGGSRQIE